MIVRPEKYGKKKNSCREDELREWRVKIVLPSISYDLLIYFYKNHSEFPGYRWLYVPSQMYR